MRTLVADVARGTVRAVARCAGYVRFVPPERPAAQENGASSNVAGNLVANVIGGIR